MPFGRDRQGQFLSKSVMWHDKMVVGERQSELKFKIVMFGEGIDLASQTPRLLAHSEVVTLDSAGRNRVRCRGVLQHFSDALRRSIHHLRRDLNNTRTLSMLAYDGIQQVLRRNLVGLARTTGLSGAGWLNRLPIHRQQRIGIVRQVITGEKRMCSSSLFFRHFTSCLPIARLRLPATQAGTILLTGAKAIQIHASPYSPIICSIGVRCSSFLRTNVHNSSNWHSAR